MCLLDQLGFLESIMVSEAALGTIVIRDGAVGATVLATFDVPIGSGTAGEPVVYQIDVPGNGIYCPNVLTLSSQVAWIKLLSSTVRRICG